MLDQTEAKMTVEEIEAREIELFGGHTFADFFQTIYLKTDVSKLNDEDRAAFYKLAYDTTKTQVPNLIERLTYLEKLASILEKK